MTFPNNAPPWAPQQQAPAQPQAAPPPALTGNMAGALAALNAAKAGNISSRRLPDIAAAYIVEIDTAEIKRTPRHGIMGFVAFKVVESSCAQVRPGATHDWGRGLEPGNDEFEYGRNDIKGWICSCIDHLHPGSGGQWNDQFTPYVFAVDPVTPEQHPQPARGTHWLATVRAKPPGPRSRTAKDTWVLDWQPVPTGTTLAQLGHASAPAFVLGPTGVTPMAAFAPPPVAMPNTMGSPGVPFTPTPMAPPSASTPPPIGWPPGFPWPPPGVQVR